MRDGYTTLVNASSLQSAAVWGPDNCIKTLLKVCVYLKGPMLRDRHLYFIHRYFEEVHSPRIAYTASQSRASKQKHLHC